METRTREKIAEQAPSLEELIEKLRIDNMATIEQYKYVVDLLKKGNNKGFNTYLNRSFTNETNYKSIEEFKEFLITIISEIVVLYQNSLDWKKTKKKDDKYYVESNKRVAFENKYKELLTFKNISVETDKEVEWVKWLVDWIVK